MKVSATLFCLVEHLPSHFLSADTLTLPSPTASKKAKHNSVIGSIEIKKKKLVRDEWKRKYFIAKSAPSQEPYGKCSFEKSFDKCYAVDFEG